MTWHDARLRGVRNGPWAIPVAVDGQRAQIRGEITRARVPPAWLWVGIGVLLAAATALLLARRSIEQIRNAAGWLGWIAALATLASAIGFAAAPTAAEGIWVEGANEIVLALVGVAFLIRGSRNAKAIAGGLLGLLALAVGLTKLPDLTHGVVLPRCPASSRAWR